MSYFEIGNLKDSSYRDFVGNGDFQDTYRFNFPSTGSLNVSAEGVSSGINIELRDSQENLVKSISTSGTNTRSINIDSLIAGDYILRVYPVSGDTNYQMSLTVDGKTDSLTGLRVASSYSNEWELYTVKPGDNLSAIAQATTGNANDYWQIANYNNISNPNLINVGQQIWVPKTNSGGTVTPQVTQGNSNGWELYTVKPGDNLSAIAQATTGNANDYWQIANYNNISNPNLINVGQLIWVPKTNSGGTVTTEIVTENTTQNSNVFLLDPIIVGNNQTSNCPVQWKSEPYVKIGDNWFDKDSYNIDFYQNRAYEGYGNLSWLAWTPGVWSSQAISSGTVSSLSAAGFDNSAALLSHFLDNTGTPATISLDEAVQESPKVKTAVDRTINQLKTEVENAVRNQYKSGKIETGFQGTGDLNWNLQNGGDFNWYGALGNFDLNGVAQFEWVPTNGTNSCAGTLNINYTIGLADTYDFSPAEYPQWLLNQAGVARNFETSGMLQRNEAIPYNV